MRTLVIPTERKTQLVDITAEVRQALRGQSGQVAVVFVPHTTAGVVLQASGEGATAVAADLEAALERIVDEGWNWKHTEEGRSESLASRALGADRLLRHHPARRRRARPR
jgi:thiamine phosphate synthase YjbQ (UPF0047 family)